MTHTSMLKEMEAQSMTPCDYHGHDEELHYTTLH